MNFEHSEKVKGYQNRLQEFMDEHIYPVEVQVARHHHNHDHDWSVWPGLEDLKAKAREAGLWNLFLPKSYGDLSPGLSNLEYAPLAEMMGRVLWSSEVFNCSAPDTGNMEVLAKYGTDAQQKKYLSPLMKGEIRSAFLMTEPQVASSDATNIETSIVKDGDEYVINGHKVWSSGALHPNCEVAIIMGKTDPTAARHVQQSMILVPIKTPGVDIKRPLTVFGYNDSPEGHGEITLNDVRVPASNLLLGEGRGFEIAQGRLGPGRIHHCMRLIGMAQRSLELMAKRANERTTFGKVFRDYSSIRQEIAISKCEIDQARLLCLSAADKMDREGNKAAKEMIAMIKIVAPNMALKVIDRSMQIHGGMGLSQDFPMAHYFAAARMLRLADGPDEVHMYQLGKSIIKRWAE
jgi:acyl-CoA dehydrogenase